MTTRRALLAASPALLATLLAARRVPADAAPPARDGGPGDGGTTDDVDGALRRIAAARAGLKSLAGPFTQERTLGLLASTVRSRGRLTLVAPDRLRWELGEPDGITYWVLPEGLFYKSRSGSGRAPRMGNARAGAALEDVRALMAGDLGLLRRRYRLALAPTPDPSEIAFDATPLAPGSPSIAFAVARDGGNPRWVRITEGPKDRSVITFGPLVRDGAVDPALLVPPPT